MSKNILMGRATPNTGGINGSNFATSWLSSFDRGGQFICTVAGTLSNLRAHGVDPGAGNSLTLTIYKNGVATSLSVALTSGIAQATDSVNTVSVAVGDLIYLRSTPVSVPTVVATHVSMDYDSTTVKTYSYGGSLGGNAGTTTRYGSPFGGLAATTVAAARGIFPLAGTITGLYARTEVASGGSGSWIVALYLNGVLQDGTGATVDTQVTINNTTAVQNTAFTLPIAAGDAVTVACIAVGTPASTGHTWGLAFTGTDEKFILFSDTPNNNLFFIDVYVGMPTGWSIWATTEAQEQQEVGVTGFDITALYVAYASDHTRTTVMQVRLNGANAGLSVTLVSPTFAGNASGTVTVVDGDLINYFADNTGFGGNIACSVSVACDAGASGPPGPDESPVWLPVFPSALPHAPLKLQPYHAGLGFPLPGNAAEEIGWKPWYPDYLRPFEVRPLLAPQQAAILLPFARTRFYFPSSSDAVPVSPTFGTAWTRTDLADRLRLNHRPRGTAFTSVTRQMDTSTNPGFVLTRQYVSSSLHAGRIDGAIKGALRALESHSNVAGTVAVRIALCNSTGGDLREVLAVTAITPTATPPEFSTSTLTNRRFQNSAALFSVPVTTPRTVNAGDHLVVEIGFRENANQPSRNATLRVGDFLTTLDQATDDLPENETSTSDLNPWIEVSVGLEAILHWQPTFPARVPAVATAAYLQYDATVVNAEELPPAPLIWKPEYPDLLLPPARSVPDHPANARGPIRPIVVALFQWQPTFPDVIDRLDHTALRQYTTALGPQAFLPINERQWAAVYPSFLFRPPPTALYLSPIGQNLDPLANAASPELAWKPIYPDWIDPAAGLAAALYQFTDRLPRDIPDVTALSWSPTAPSRIVHRPDRTAEQRVFDWQFLFPTPDLLAGLHWRSEYPSHFPVPQVTLGQVADPLSPVGPTPIDWDPLGELHPRYPPPRVMSPFTAEPPPSVQPVVAARMGWIPRYDGLLWRLVPLTAPFGGWTPEPTIGASAILCIGITDEFVTAPQLNPAALTLSDLIDEAVTTPTLLASEVC